MLKQFSEEKKRVKKLEYTLKTIESKEFQKKTYYEKLISEIRKNNEKLEGELEEQRKITDKLKLEIGSGHETVKESEEKYKELQDVNEQLTHKYKYCIDPSSDLIAMKDEIEYWMHQCQNVESVISEKSSKQKMLHFEDDKTVQETLEKAIKTKKKYKEHYKKLKKKIEADDKIQPKTDIKAVGEVKKMKEIKKFISPQYTNVKMKGEDRSDWKAKYQVINDKISDLKQQLESLSNKSNSQLNYIS